MHSRRPSYVRSCLILGISISAAQLFSSAAQAQDLGHKLLGTLGLDAGSMPPPGLYLAERLIYYSADEVRDRNGDVLEVPGFDLNAFGNAVGVAGAVPLPELSAKLGAAIAVPIAAIHVRTDRAEASIDRFGLGDVMIKPLQIGFDATQWSALAEYSLYIPTGHFELRDQGVSLGHVTHQFSAGGVVGAGAEQQLFASLLVSYDMNQRKRDIDIVRGDTLQLQGGAGFRPSRAWELGVAGYALWQIEDDQGGDLPPVLRGARERAYGAGPEVAVRIDSIGLAFRLRYEVELDAVARPRGQIAVLGITLVAATLQ